KKLGLDKDEMVAMRRTIKRLARAGKLSYGKNHVVYPEGKQKLSKRKEVIGRFQRAAAGYGFVRPLKSHGDRTHDIFVPANKTDDAADGDRVRVQISRERGRDNRIRGRIVEIVARRAHQFVGTYFEQGGYGFVNVDGGTFNKAVLVGDPGASGVMADDKVVIEMVRFPTAFRHGEGVITKVLGDRGEPGVDTQLIMHEFGLPEEFSAEALADARAAAEVFDESIGPNRTDFIDTTVITIDPHDARDFDDAISLKRLENGHWQLGVHIADVSHFVRPHTALDDEAKDRATSVYLPNKVIPMLPEVISNNLASLQPDRVRYTKTALIEFTAEGAVVDTEVRSGAIKSKRRFTYEEVDEFLADREAWREKVAADVHQLLTDMHELAMMLRKRRMEGGAINLAMPEVELDLDRQGRVTGAHETVNTESHQIIEEFMLAANQAVAQMFDDKGLFFLRRTHENPDPRKLKALTQFVRILGFEVESLESRFEIIRLLDMAEGTPQARAVNFAVLRSMKKAIYSPEEITHFALNSKHYCHFTSPIRRYPDLTVHRLIDQINSGKKPVQDFAQLEVLGDHCSEREQRAERADRELTKLKLLLFLNERIGEQMDAVVTGVEAYGMFVQGTELPAEGLVHLEAMQDDYYDFDETAFALVGQRQGNSYTLGDALRVEIAHVDLDQRNVDFKLVTGSPRKRAAKQAGKQPAKQQSKRTGRPRGSKPGKRTEKQEPQAQPKAAGKPRKKKGAAANKKKGGKPTGSGKRVAKKSGNKQGAKPKGRGGKSKRRKS
ncbi:MAG: ribonuclease R, partial [Planctomycetota bacterium]